MARYAATTTAIEKGLENVSPDAGVKLVDDWVEQLQASDKPALKKLAGDLDRLKKELGKGEEANDATVRKLLAKLGQATVKSADEAEGANVQKLKDLGEALASAGAGDDVDETEDEAEAA